jgi:hypothetical protein
VLVSISKATGSRWHTCPWQALADPFVGAVFRAHPHWSKGQIGALYGGEGNVPAVLLEGLALYDGALKRVQSHDMEAERKRREQEDEARARQAQHGNFARPITAPRFRR